MKALHHSPPPTPNFPPLLSTSEHHFLSKINLTSSLHLPGGGGGTLLVSGDSSPLHGLIRNHEAFGGQEQEGGLGHHP